MLGDCGRLICEGCPSDTGDFLRGSTGGFRVPSSASFAPEKRRKRMKEDAIKLLNAVKDYQRTKEEIRFQIALNLLRPLMKSMVKDVKSRWWEDLQQEMTYGVWKVISAFKIDGNDDEKDSKRLLSAIKKAAESRKLNFLKSKYVRETESYLSLDQLAEKQRDEDDDCDDEKEELEDPSEEILQVSESDSKSSRFEDAIASLSDKDKAFLNVLQKVGFNLSEYARRKGISRQAVAKRISGIKKKLRKFIG